MPSFNLLVAPSLAALILIAGMSIAVPVVKWRRAHGYRASRIEAASGPSARFRFNDAPTAESFECLAPLRDLSAAAHAKAIAAQNVYVAAIVGAATCLVIAFVALALATTRLAQSHEVEAVLAWLDVIAVALVIVLVWYGRKASRRWIGLRTKAELLRQDIFVLAVFPGLAAAGYFDAGRQAERIASVEKDTGNTAVLMEAIDRYWSARRSAIQQFALSNADLAADAIRFYFARRAARQLRWFSESKLRLEHSGAARQRWLFALYWGAFALAAGKLAIHLTYAASGDTDWSFTWRNMGAALHEMLLPALLIVTGLSAALTAYYLNQNARSLVHRYNTQLRRIKKWLDDFAARWPLHEYPTLRFDAAEKGDIRERILEFEDLMVEELNDWIHISSLDVIEIAP